MGRPVNVARDYVAIAKQYAIDVTTGKIPACLQVRQACQRQIDDLKRKGWRWKFNHDRANRICKFIELLPHVKGKWKSKYITLEPWQCFFLTCVFGWINAQGIRRFRKALVAIPRKNAKTTIAAGVGLYLLAADGENGSEVYSAATTRDQARISWDIARRMAQKSPGFRDRYGVDPLAHSIAIESEGAFFKPLSRDADTLEGLNPHGAIIDELHAHKTREVFDVLDEATGSRRQPLIFIISTEGDNATGVFAEQRAYLEQVLSGRHEDESYFGIIYTIDKEDSWTDPASWIKANPNYGVSVLAVDLESRFRQAEKNPESQGSFLCKRLNVRVGARTGFFNMLAWENICKDTDLKVEDFYAQNCWIGIDLASKSDIAAVIQLFRLDAKWFIFGRYYLPEDRLERGNPNYDVYRGWADKGFLTITPGNITDYEYIERDLLENMRNFRVQQVAIDPWNAQQFNTRMQQAGVPIVEVPQNVNRMSSPMKEFGAFVASGTVKHDGNPCMTWMMGNVEAKLDAKDNVYPRKARPDNKIDGPVAAITAFSAALVAKNVVSIYKSGVGI